MFCDDIRQEMDGKHFLIGCYQGSFFLNEFPAAIPKFGVYVTIFEPMELAEARTSGILLQILLPGDDPKNPSISGELPYQEGAVAEIKSKTPHVDDPITEAGVRMVLTLSFSPLNIAQPGLIKVQVRYQEDIIELGTLRVYHQSVTPS